MKIVLDTCALIWWTLDPNRLSATATDTCKIMEKEQNGLVASISIWEIAIKIKNKKLDLGVDLNDYVTALKKSSAIAIIPIGEDLWLKSVQLKWTHKDPADRVIVALARSNQASIITSDKVIKKFYPDVIW